MKSKVPSRIPSIIASTDGRMTMPIMPEMKKWIPTSSIIPVLVQPSRLVVWEKITQSPITWASRVITALITAKRNSPRYCMKLSMPSRK